jgi:hypothetical protein
MSGILQLSGTQTVGPVPGQIAQGTPVVGQSQLQIMLQQLMNSQEAVVPVALPAATTIPIPVGSNGCIIIPPQGSATTMTLKGVVGDTGVVLSSTRWSVISFDPSQTSFVLTPASPITALTTIQFF